MSPSTGIAVLGAGPAGLTAAYVLARRGVAGTVFEAEQQVGGIAKTVQHGGYRFDLGGHRFFTKLEPVQQLWEQVLGEELLVRPRLSRIYFHGSFFSYPLQARDVLRGLGMVESARCAASYLAAQVRPPREEATFEDWVVARFGRRLYRNFFGPYTEKVWGIPGTEIRAEWAAQRIKGFSFAHAVRNILGLEREQHTTLIEEFHYPRLGPGQMWEQFATDVEAAGIPVRLGARVQRIHHADGRVRSVTVREHDAEIEHPVDAVLSSLALVDLVACLDPTPPAEVLEAAGALRYRDFCLVALVLDGANPFPDNWIYLHDPGIRAGRVQNFGAWSPDLVVPGTTCLGAEYFCFEGDDVWAAPDEDLVRMTVDQLASIGLVDPAAVRDGVCVRVPKAYPMYDDGYAAAVAEIREHLERFDNLHTFGRNGLHRYNNQDHSMWTAILATLNELDGADHDVWSVNTERVYLEAGARVDGLLEVSLVA